jgi:CheY-like chemotaxis protein
VKGTGLGLPLARRLAALLGGSVRVKSQLGTGSTFSAIVPARYSGPAEVSLVSDVTQELDPARTPVLVVEDSPETLFVYERYLRDGRYQMVPACTVRQAREWLRLNRPGAIVLDILLEAGSSWAFLSELKESEGTRDIPVVVVTLVDNEKRALAHGAAAFHRKPVPRDWLVGRLDELIERRTAAKILVVDDDEVSRYLLRGMLAGVAVDIVEASTGREGILKARADHPSAIFLDLSMPEIDGFAVLEDLRNHPETSAIPVIVHSSKRLTDGERSRLAQNVAAIVPKEAPSREAAIAAVRQALGAAGVSVPEGPTP